MDARFHHRVAGIIVAALVGMSGCGRGTTPTTGGGTTTPGGGTTTPGGGTTTPGGGTTTPGGGTTTPGGGTTTPGTPTPPGGRRGQKPGGRGTAQPGQAQPGQAQPGQAQPGQAQPGQAQPGQAQPGQAQPGKAQPGRGQAQPSRTSASEVFNQAWFGGMASNERESTAVGICGNVRAATEHTSSQATYQVGSDAEIVAILAALAEGDAQQGAFAADNASSSAVREYARLLVVSGEQGGEKELGRRVSTRAAEGEWSRAIRAGFSTSFSALDSARGESFDREFVGRQIVLHQRTLELLDALAAQTQSSALRCEIMQARAVAAIHLEMACRAWAALDSEESAGREARRSQQAGGEEQGQGGKERRSQQAGGEEQGQGVERRGQQASAPSCEGEDP
jgi:predicted outer membrane protein